MKQGAPTKRDQNFTSPKSSWEIIIKFKERFFTLKKNLLPTAHHRKPFHF